MAVEVFVFVEKTVTSEQRLVTVSPVAQLRWALAQRYPWLEIAWVRANLTALQWPNLAMLVPRTATASGERLAVA